MGVRVVTPAILLWLLAWPAWAQDGLRSASLPERTPMDPVPSARTDRFLAPPGTYPPPDSRPVPFPPYPHGPVFLPGPFFAYPYPPYVKPSRRDGREHRGEYAGRPFARRQSGYLQLLVGPAAARVYVDGYYVGTVDDFTRIRPGRPLGAGPHRIEVRAPGFETATFDVRIEPDETVTYRADLEPARPEPAAAPAPAEPKTFYVIPGCYAGDRRPDPAALRPGCPIANLRTIPPD